MTNESAEASPLSGWVFAGNLFSKNFASTHPAGNFYASTVSGIGFVSYTGRNFTLSSSSAFKGKATDGTDPGADIARLTALTAGVVQ